MVLSTLMPSRSVLSFDSLPGGRSRYFDGDLDDAKPLVERMQRHVRLDLESFDEDGVGLTNCRDIAR